MATGTLLTSTGIWQAIMMTSVRRVPLINSFHLLVFIGLWLFWVVSPEGAAAAPQNMEITVRENLVSVHLVDAPLDAILQELGQKLAFKAHLHGELTDPITLSFVDLPLEKGLRLLTAKQSLSIAYGPAKASLQQHETTDITDIWVFGGGSTPKKPGFTAARVPPLPGPGAGSDPEFSEDDAEDQPDEGPEDNMLLDQILNNPQADRSNQRQAIQDLVEIGDVESVLIMADYLVNADEELRQMLINGIGSVQIEPATRVLGQLLQAESDPEIRKTVVRALAQRQGDSVAKGLLEEALNDKDAGVKTLARQLLAK